MKNRVSMKFIAEKAGVDVAIVSKIINGRANGEVSAQKRALVEQLIREYDYVPMASARTLVTGKNHQIAFLISSETTLGLANYYYGTILSGVYNACAKHGYQCVVNIFDFSKVETFIMPDNMKRLSIDGVILTGVWEQKNIERLSNMDLPLILTGTSLEQNIVPTVGMDREKVFRSVLKYAYLHGHIRIAIDNPPVLPVFQRLAAEYAGMTVVSFDRAKGQDSFSCGMAGAKVYAEMRQEERPTFLLANDQFSAVFLEEAAKYGIVCPGDISIVATDTPVSRWNTPHLSVLEEPAYEYGAYALGLLLDMIDKKISWSDAKEAANRKMFPCQILERNSVRDISSV